MLAGTVVGGYYYFKLLGEARRAGYTTRELLRFGVYRYAAVEKRGSPETRRMRLGFVVATVFFCVMWVAGALLR